VKLSVWGSARKIHINPSWPKWRKDRRSTESPKELPFTWGGQRFFHRAPFSSKRQVANFYQSYCLSLEDARNILFSSSFRIPVRLQPPFPAPPWSWERWYIDPRTALLARFCDIIEICFAEITRDFYDGAHSLSSTPIICIFNPPRKYVCGLSSRGIIKIYSRRTINCTRSE